MFVPLLVAAFAAPLPPQGDARPDRTPRDRGANTERTDRGTLDGLPDGPAANERAPDGQAETRVQPRIAPPPRDYVLGVYAYNTDEGVIVTGVVPGSPAARSGFERGDRIVSVDGFQVGYVKGTLYPLGREIRLRSDRRGQVTLLVQNVRNQSLLNLDVRTGRGRPGIPRPINPTPFERSDAGDRGSSPREGGRRTRER